MANSIVNIVTTTIEKLVNKVTSWSVTTLDTNYPSEKLVKDSLDLKQQVFTGIDVSTPIGAADISINYDTRVLTLTPPLGYFYYFTDGTGVSVKRTVTGVVNFPAFSNTSGNWYFYFDSTGTAITTQTVWSNFDTIATIYSLVWNVKLHTFTVTSATAVVGDTYTNNGFTFTVLESITSGTTLKTSGTGTPTASGNLSRATGAGTNPIVFSSYTNADKSVVEMLETHENSISSADHKWKHAYGSIWHNGLNIFSNKIATGTPNADGRNVVVSLSGGAFIDDNQTFTITNSATPALWSQDLGNNTPASLNATNGGMFDVYLQDGTGLISEIEGTKFPFAFSDAGIPQLISSTGVRTAITSNDFFVYYIFSVADSRFGEVLKLVNDGVQYTSLTNANASNWSTIQSMYAFLSDTDKRPLYKLTFEYRNSYNIGTKYSALRQIDDLRKTQITQTGALAGSVNASSVIYVPTAPDTFTNVQSQLEIGLTQSGSKLSATVTNTSTTTYLADLSPVLNAYANTNRFYINFSTYANTTTTPTLNINSLGDKTIKQSDGSAIPIGALKGIKAVAYDGTYIILLEKVIGTTSGTVATGNDSRFNYIYTIGIDIAGQGNVLVAEELEGVSIVPFTGTIIGWYLYETSTTPIATTTEIDVWKDSYANFPPTIADTIWGTKPKLTAQTKNTASGLSIAVTQYDTLKYKLVSNDLGKNIKLGLIIQKS